MKTLARLATLPLLLALALAAPAVAQTPVPPLTTPVSWSTQVIGTLVNRTEGGAVPDRLDLVLHAWDADLNERLMLDGQSGPAGTFRFEDVPVEPGLLYSVMATYEGVSYFSEPVRAIEGENLPPFEVPIYETTTDTSQIQIERMHVMFLASHAGLEVAEVYSLSNLGDRAVNEAVSLADGTPATFEFPLPTGATNVAFYPDGSNRFVRTPGGFADTGSLLPGAGSGQIMVKENAPIEAVVGSSIDGDFLGLPRHQGHGRGPGSHSVCAVRSLYFHGQVSGDQIREDAIIREGHVRLADRRGP